MPARMPPAVQNQREPTLGELYSTAQNLYNQTGDERLGKTIKQIETQDGTMTDQDIGRDLNNMAKILICFAAQAGVNRNLLLFVLKGELHDQT